MFQRSACLFFTALFAGCITSEVADEGPAVVRSTECRRATGAIRIDGVADEPAWANALELKEFAVFWQRRKPRTATVARLLWDDDSLYFHSVMEDSDIYADVKQHNGMTWFNDVFELFFKPSDNQRTYYEFQVNALNTQLELFFPSRGAGGYQRFAPLTKFGMESAVKLDGTLNNWQDQDKGWSVEGRIPWTAFTASGGKPNVGAAWRFSLSRYDYSATFERAELSATAPLTQSDFHRYEDFGRIKFVGP